MNTIYAMILLWAVLILTLFIYGNGDFDQRIFDECVLESTEVTNDLRTYCESYTRQYLRYNGE